LKPIKKREKEGGQYLMYSYEIREDVVGCYLLFENYAAKAVNGQMLYFAEKKKLFIDFLFYAITIWTCLYIFYTDYSVVCLPLFVIIIKSHN
jgi:hypothetical protein